jgi:hypothetical protein
MNSPHNAARALAPNFGTPTKVLPSQSEPLSDLEFQQSLQVCDWIASITEARDKYLEVNKLDVAINNPAANWSLDNSFYDGYRALTRKNYDNINMLRVFSQIFSGHYLGVVDAAGRQVPKSVPRTLDEEVSGYLVRKPDTDRPWWFKRYRNLISGFPDLAKLSPPAAFGESGWLIDDVIVNHDTYVYMERVALLSKSGLVENLRQRERPVILEIGSGYGALAYFIKRLVPRSVYICLDLPESLMFAGIYLSRYFLKSSLLVNPNTDIDMIGNHDCVFVPNYLFHRLVEAGVRVDLAINTLSMSEMSAPQVAHYCEGLKRMLGSEGHFFEQNQDNKPLGMIYAADVIRRHFNYATTVSIHTDLTQGVPTVWSNRGQSTWIQKIVSSALGVGNVIVAGKSAPAVSQVR